MGTSSSIPEESKWKFVGREKDFDNVKKLMQIYLCVLIFGMKKIGKSSFSEYMFNQLRESSKCIWKDFDDDFVDDTDNGKTVYDWFRDFLSAINASGEEKSDFEKKYASKRIACSKCEKCKNQDTDQCIQKDKLIKAAIKTLIETLKKEDNEIVLFLDNIDCIMNSTLKDNFLAFLKQLLKVRNVRTVITSSTKPKFVEKSFTSYELKPLNEKAILDILFETCELRELSNNSFDNDKDVCLKVSYSPEHLVFKEDNKAYIKAIVGLCEGLPLAACMSGLLLTEDDGLFTPANVVEILICMRLTGLSPDNCPPEDRLDIYREPMQQVTELASCFNCMNERLVGNEFSIDMAVEVAIETVRGVATEAMAKQKVLKKCLDKSIISIKKLPGSQQLNWHGILRECQASLQAISEIDSDEMSETKEMVWKFMKENATKAGLELGKEILRDPKFLEEAIKNLSIKDVKPVQATDEKKILSLSDENSLASKEFMQAKTTVVKHVSEKVLPTDLENNQNVDSKGSKKIEYRYQASEDEGGSDLDFEVQSVINERQCQHTTINGINGTSIVNNEGISDDPPPYTTLPSNVELNAAMNRSNTLLQYSRNQPHVNNVGEPPPPSYHSSTSTYRNINARDDSSDDPLNRSKMQTASWRSRSMSTIYQGKLDFIDENVTEKSIQYVKHLRPRSYPPYDRLNIDLNLCWSDRPMKEMDIQSSYSLTGPPALAYIPPHIHRTKINGLKDSAHHNPKTGLLINNTSEATPSSLNIDNQKGPMHQTQTGEETRFSVDSTVGPEAMSYKYTSKSDPANEESTRNYSTHSQRSVNGDFAQNDVRNESRLSVKQEELVSQRRSPTAIVSPMPRRQSPPIVTKQNQPERQVQSVSPFRPQ